MAGITGTETTGATAPSMHTDISSSLASLWSDYSGARPADVKTTIHENKVRCTLNDAVRDFDTAITAAAGEDIGRDGRRLTMATFRGEAIRAVSRITHRQVLAFVSDHDAKTDVATEVFIVDSPPAAARSIFVAKQNLED